MKKASLPLVLLLVFCAVPLFSVEQENILGKIIEALTTEKNIIEAKRVYDLALVGERYNFLQWWKPSLIISNDLVYPYKRDTFDDLATEDTASLGLSLPLHTGTIIDFSAGYSVNRGMTELLEWGFSQNVRGKIGISQSLNPWWLYTRQNPYKSGASLQVEMGKTEYNIAIKNVLFSCVSTFISLRKTERTVNILTEKINLFNDIIVSYRQKLIDGGISVREFEDLRKDKWEYEQELFVAEQNVTVLRNDLLNVSGISVEQAYDDRLIAADDSFWTSIFLGVNEHEITQLEQRGIELQKDSLMYEKLITRQNNAPALTVEFGSSFLLPERDIDNLNDAWEEKYFTDNERNNWSIGISLNLSGFLTAAHRKYNSDLRLKEAALDLLSERAFDEKEIQRNENTAIIRLLEGHISQLTAIVDNESAFMQDYKVLYDRGSLSELEYRQALLEYTEKCMLLDNFNDDLWLHQFLAVFYL